MMANMNLMENMMQFQNLMNMKMQLTNIESQFNYLLTNMQNMGITPDSYNNLNNISFQFINFGIELLNMRIQKSFNILNNINLEKQIDNIINNLNNIKLNNPINMNQNMDMINFQNLNKNAEMNNNKPKYNVCFTFETGKKTLIYCDMDITLYELIKMLLIKIGRNDLFDNEEKELLFLYNGVKINNLEYKSKKLIDIFGIKSYNISIFYKNIGF